MNVRDKLQPFQASFMFVAKAMSIPLSGAPESSFTGAGSSLIYKHYVDMYGMPYQGQTR